MSLLTVRGLNNYDPKLFDGLEIPDFWDKETLVGCILERTDERECLYSNPSTLANAITVWCHSNYAQWLRLATALAAEYEPLENYDRREDWTDNSKTTGNSSGTSNGNANADTTTKATGYNSNELAVTGAVNDSATNSTTTTSDTTTDNSASHTGHVHGNIGVTTSQQMLQSEIDLRKYNWYYEVADDFRYRFTLGVW